MKCAVKDCQNEAINPPHSIIENWCEFHRGEFGQKVLKPFFKENWEEIKLGAKVTTDCVKNPEAEKIVKEALRKALLS